MMRTRLTRALAAILLMLGLGMVPGSVLCVGSDGHLAIESAAADCCFEVHGGLTAVHTEQHCPPACVDTPLGSNVLSRTSDRPDVGPVLAVLSVGGAGQPALFEHHIIASRVAAFAPPPPRVLRTTVQTC